MKKIIFCIFYFLFIFISSSKNITNSNNLKSNKSNYKHSCRLGNNLYQIKKVKFTNNKRKLEDDEQTYIPINIYYDMTYLNQQKLSSSNDIKKKIDMIDKSMSLCVRVFKKLLYVKKPLNSPIKIKTEQDLKEWKFTKYKINSELMPSSKGIECDLVLLIRFKNENEDMKYEFPDASAVYLDEYTKRPIVGILVINDEFEIKTNSQEYLDFLLLHGITHILGFSYNLFSSFPGQLSNTILIEKEKRTNKEKYKIKTPKVLEFAKKYFNCNSITGVELENKEGNVNPSHWEARILLGEYMNSEPYTAEQVISEFTLALLEDSGWYKANYYTGGLMRFGKNQGCEFINKDCLTYKSFIYEVNFKNEFCNPAINWVPSCSSGRQSRSYCSTELNEIDPDFQRFGNYRGRPNADYCFVNDYFPSEENLAHYVGSCKKGQGNYGSNILYNDNIKESNSKIPEKFGEKYGNNSFCVLSSVIPTLKSNKDIEIYNKYVDVIHSMCYPMFCTEKSLTIQINDQYIVCPRQGGKIELMKGYTGELYCPDYNLICTGTIPCNDMFDCVEKESLAKNNTYEYDYIIQTSQHLPDLLKSNIEEGYEETENEGKCPKNCQQCFENKKCYKCRTNYKLIGVKKNDSNPIICIDTDDISLYYQDKEDNTYYKCPDNCLNCKNGGICTVCDNIHRLNEEKNICEEKVPNCEKYDLNNEDCLLCKENYFFINKDRRHCFNNLDNKNKYFSENNNIIYYTCEHGVSNCEECLNKQICTKCQDNYFFINDERGICYNEIDKNKYYPEGNNKIYYSCNRNLPNCEECLNKDECTKCKEGYFFINEDRSKCYNEIEEKKYYPENNGTIYYSCNKNLPNCEECLNKNQCTKCKEGYFFINEDKTQCINVIDEKKYYPENNNTIYYSCDYNLPHCEECLNKYQCTKCKNGFFFINEDRTQCFNDIEKNKYYPEFDGTVYYFCEYNLPNCEECSSKNTCTKCKNNYFFINYDRSKCYNKLDDYNKYYSNDDKTIYYSCNTSISHCETCKNKDKCIKCMENYFFINEDRTICYNKIDEKKYYPEEGGKVYYSCSYNIKNCFECENKNKCLLCEDNYYLSGKNYLCFPISTIPYEKCQIISSNLENDFQIFNDKNYLLSLVNDYINNYNDINYIVKHYSNINNNYTISIFKASICTKLLYESGFYSLDTNQILKNVNLDFLYNNDNYIHFFITYGLQNYFILYNTEINSFLSISNFYSNISFNISNDLTHNLNNLIGKETTKIIKDNKLNIFNKKESIFNNICNNVTIQGIDLPYKYRMNKLYLGRISDSVICTSDKCKSKSLFIDNLTGICECNVNEEINYLLNQPENIFLNIYKNSTEISDSFKIFGCFHHNYNISANVGFIISLIFIIFHIISICLYFVFKKKIYGFKEFANPPVKHKVIVIENDLEDDEENNEEGNDDKNEEIVNKEKDEMSYIDFSNCDEEKRNQEKDIVYEDDINDNNINTIKSIKKYSQKEERKDAESYNSKKNNNKNIKLEINNDENNEDNISDFLNNKKNNLNKEETKENNSENKNITIKKREIKNSQNELKSSDNRELIEENEKNIDEEFFDKNNSIIKINRIKKKNLRNIIKIKNKQLDKDEEEKNNIFKHEKKISYDLKIKSSIKEDMKNNSNQSNTEEKINMTFNTNMPEDNKDKELEIEREHEKFYDKNFKNLHKETSDRLTFKKNNIENNNNNFYNNKKIMILFRNEEEENNSKIDFNNSYINNLPFNEIELNDNRTYIMLYWNILSLKQPIINIFSFIKYFNITQSYIPLPIKINKFLFMILLNIFINSINLSQKYFLEKYEFFNKKYNFVNNDGKIRKSEIMGYSMKKGFKKSMISFVFCLIIYYLIDYIFFNIRKKINNLSFEKNTDLYNNILNRKIVELIKLIRKKIIIYIYITSVLYIIIFIYIVNFSFAYPGGILDCLSNTIITFIFLQIFPFITSLIICFMRYFSISKKNRIIYEFAQILYS